MSESKAQQVLAGDDNWSLDLSNGVLKLSAHLALEGVAAEAKVEVDAGVFIDKLKDLIPGKVDDAIFDVIKLALKSVA